MVVMEMFLHLEMSSVLRRLQCCTRRNKDLDGIKVKSLGIYILSMAADIDDPASCATNLSVMLLQQER